MAGERIAFMTSSTFRIVEDQQENLKGGETKGDTAPSPGEHGGENSLLPAETG
jgi:hypothetical protein